MASTVMDPSIRRLADYAKLGNWTEAEKLIPEAVKNPAYVDWAYRNALSSSNPKLKVLGASMLEKAVIDEKQFSEMRDKLYYRMIEDKHPYVRYKSAFAIAAHGTGRYLDSVMTVLIDALIEDDDVSEIARKYLVNLK